MALSLNDYIKQNQLNPNPVLLSQLGASQELIDYLLYTPENTNFVIAKQLINEEEESESTPDKEDEMIVYLASDGNYISNAEFASEDADFSNPTPKEIFDFCEAYHDGDVAENITVMVFSDFPPITSNYTFHKIESEWMWYDEARGYYFAIQSNGTWRAGSDN